MRHVIYKIIGTPECRDGIQAAELSQMVSLTVTESNAIRFVDAEGRLLGRVTASHRLARLLAQGEEAALYCSVNMISLPGDRHPDGKVHIRVVLGVPGETYTPPAPTAYPLSIVGESHYQAAIRKCRPSDPVIFWHEPDNPYDDLALVVRTAEGDRIGYVPRGSWVRDAVLRDGRGASATILSIQGHEFAGIVLSVALGGDPVSRWLYFKSHPEVNRPAETPLPAEKPEAGAAPRKGWLSRLFGL